MNYTVGDIAIRIKNAAMANRKVTLFPFTKISKEVCRVLVKQGFLASAKEEEREGKKVLVVTIAYKHRVPVLTNVELVSKPSLRVYVKTKHAKDKQRRVSGVSVFSTSAGILTGAEASKQGIGGELL